MTRMSGSNMTVQRAIKVVFIFKVLYNNRKDCYDCCFGKSVCNPMICLFFVKINVQRTQKLLLSCVMLKKTS